MTFEDLENWINIQERAKYNLTNKGIWILNGLKEAKKLIENEQRN